MCRAAQPGGIEPAGGAVRGRLNRDRIGHAGDRQPLLPAQLGAEDRARRAPRGRTAEQTGQDEHALDGPARGAPAGVGKHEVGVGPAPYQAQQCFDMRRLDPGVLAHELLELGQLHLDGGGET